MCNDHISKIDKISRNFNKLAPGPKRGGSVRYGSKEKMFSHPDGTRQSVPRNRIHKYPDLQKK